MTSMTTKTRCCSPARLGTGRLVDISLHYDLGAWLTYFTTEPRPLRRARSGQVPLALNPRSDQARPPQEGPPSPPRQEGCYG